MPVGGRNQTACRYRSSQSLIILVGLACLLCAHGPLQEPAERDLWIVVRDAAGTPLEGVTVVLTQIVAPYVEEEWRFERGGITGPDGVVELRVPPGRYLVTFQGKWGGKRFIPPAEQNAGVMTSGEAGGFALTLDPEGTNYLFTFVVAENAAGQLVPLFDLSRDPRKAPEPYTYDGLMDNETFIVEEYVTTIKLAPLEKAPEGISPDDLPQQAEGVAEEAPTRTGAGTTVLVVATVAAGVTMAALWTVLILQSRKMKGA